MEWVWRWAVRSNEDAVANARAASTALSRLRVEREEAEVYCRERYDVPAAADAADARVAQVAR
jgi:hypothetical protein